MQTMGVLKQLINMSALLLTGMVTPLGIMTVPVNCLLNIDVNPPWRLPVLPAHIPYSILIK